MTWSDRSRWVTVVIETVLFGALAGMVAIVFLPSCARSRTQARCLERVAEVRSVLEGVSTEQGTDYLTEGKPVARAGKDAQSMTLPPLATIEPTTSSWASIGGCGVGGSGGGDIRWIGRRAPGGLIETECLVSYSAGEDLKTTKVSFKASGDVPGRFNIGLQVPYLYSRRYDSDYVLFSGIDEDLVVSSMGDLALLVSRKFGMTGETVANLTIGIPTAPYDLTQGGWHIPYDAQPGRGKVTVSVGTEHIFEKDYGPIIAGLSYSYNGGENDVGDFRGDTIATYGYFSYRMERMVHSAGLNLSFSLADDRNQWTPVGGPTVLVGLQYGLEFSYPRFPWFISVLGTFSGNGVESYTVATGVVTSF